MGVEVLRRHGGEVCRCDRRHRGLDACPYIPGKRFIGWDLPDPQGCPLAEVRATRDEIAKRVRELIDQLDA